MALSSLDCNLGTLVRHHQTDTLWEIIETFSPRNQVVERIIIKQVKGSLIKVVEFDDFRYFEPTFSEHVEIRRKFNAQ